MMPPSLLPGLFKGSLILAAGWIVYYTLLKDSGQFKLNRLLMGTVLLSSLIAPWITLPIDLVNSIPLQSMPSFMLPDWSTANQITHRSFNLVDWIQWIYVGGMALLLVRLIWHIGVIVRSILQMESAQLDGVTVRIGNTGENYSFFRFLVIDRNLLRENSARKRILAHELVHIREWHSIDVLLAELVKIVFWFNPLSWMLKNYISENCEFLADRGALHRHPGTRTYAQLLVDQVQYLTDGKISYTKGHSPIIQSFHQNQIKRRLIMLNQNSNKKMQVLRYLLASAVIFSAFTFCACAQKANEQASSQNEIQNKEDGDGIGDVDQMPQYKGGTEAMMAYLSSEIKYPKSAKKNGVSGKVFIQFVVAVDGSIQKANVIKGFDPDCDAEALRVVQSMPNWEPGKKDEKAVAVLMTLPITFALK